MIDLKSLLTLITSFFAAVAWFLYGNKKQELEKLKSDLEDAKKDPKRNKDAIDILQKTIDNKEKQLATLKTKKTESSHTEIPNKYMTFADFVANRKN